MPVETHYVDWGKGAYKHAYGVLTSTDLLVTGLIQSQDVEKTRQLRYIFYDFTDVTEVRAGRDVVAQLVELNRKTASYSPGIWAAVAAPNPLLFGLARNWQTLTADFGWRSQIFHCREDALAWLSHALGTENMTSAFLDEFPHLKPAD
ncbi:MAG TPA: hypothetical protein VHY09_14720 [Candidatus Methylacidiphilales bacterium]|jgi:hypothetical protein|nr:hypothetical protein [Candidatus Methylacidiphilales bacterium]